jgi:hypothetical protein
VADESKTSTASEVTEFLERHRACAKARPWAGRWSTLAEAWDNCPVPDWLIWARKQAGFEDVEALQVWACWCVRQVAHLMTADECTEALEATERFVEGKATAEELASVAGPAAGLAEASWPCASAAWAARAAAELATLRPVAAAKAAAEAQAWTSQARAAWPKARAAQADKLRELIHPQCKGGLNKPHAAEGPRETGASPAGSGLDLHRADR